jgi:hypothetical protein
MTYSSRAYLVGSPALRDHLIAELAAAGVAAVPGPGVSLSAWAAAGHRPRLVFVRGEVVPYGLMTRDVRRCHRHRDRTESVTARGGTLPGTLKFCAECRAALAGGPGRAR